MTAKHVLFEDNGQPKSNTVYFKVWKTLNNETSGHIKFEVDLGAFDKQFIIQFAGHDIVALAIGTQSGLHQHVKIHSADGRGNVIVSSKEFVQMFDRIQVGSDAVVLGYPYSLREPAHFQFDLDKPLLRKGIVAGKYEKNKTIILDCAVFPGNSGGPALQVFRCDQHCSKDHLAVLGVVTRFIPFEQQWVNERFPQLKMKEWSNSGYSVIMSMDSLFAEIDQYKGRSEAVPPSNASNN